MGLIGNEIVQSRAYQYPEPQPEPNLNYKNTFPISVFEAIRESMEDENSETLKEVIEKIFVELRNRQPIFPSKSANNIMTFAGVPGGIGSIEISYNIPWNPSDQSNDKIPTEKAVGNLLFKLGLVDEDGNIDENGGRKIRWSDIIGRPLIYNELGDNEDGFMTQKITSLYINDIRERLNEHIDGFDNNFNMLDKKISDHIANKNNPHCVSVEQIGAASKEAFDFHTQEAINPHNITPTIIGLGNVDNTSDADKPISKATQAAIDILNQIVDDMGNSLNHDTINEITFNKRTGEMTVVYNDGETKIINIPINEAVDEMTYDKEKKQIVTTEFSGETKVVDLSDLFIRYIGSVSQNITVVIDDVISESKWNEINKSKVEETWDNNGAGYVDPEYPEINKSTVDNTWENNGEGYVDPGDGYIKKPTVDHIWETDGEGYIEPIPEYDSDETKSGFHVIRATINPLSITNREIASGTIISRLLQDACVITEKIADYTITNEKICYNTISGDKLKKYTIENMNLKDRSVDARTLFSSNVDNRVLITEKGKEDPKWGKIKSPMIDIGEVKESNIDKGAVTTDKIGNNSVTNEKIADNSITNRNVVSNSIEGNKLVSNPLFSGVPRSTSRPSLDSVSNELPDTKWIYDRIQTMVISNNNLGDRIVDGRTLFSSPIRNRVLIVGRANSDPVWGTINNSMMEKNSIDRANIKDLSIDRSKIDDRAIISRHISDRSILREHLGLNIVATENIINDAVTSEKIFRSGNANMVLAALSENGNPVYAKINRKMIENNAVGGMQIEDRSIPLVKLETSDQSNRILGVGLKNSNPTWTRVVNQMISERAVDGRTLFTTGDKDNVILAVLAANTDPLYTKINSEMLLDNIIKESHITEKAIAQKHLQDHIIANRHLEDRSITSDKIVDRGILPGKIFSSPVPNRILAVYGLPYSDPEWMQVHTEMIKDQAITREKMWQCDYEYHVIGVTQPNRPPEYLQITHQFIVDGTIIPEKLVKDFTLFGTPQMTIHPPVDSDNYQIATTKWVRETILETLRTAESLYDIITTDLLRDHCVTGKKIFTSVYEGPRVLGVTKKGEDPEYILIEEDLIVDGAVTQNKLQRDIHLLGSPEIEIRPSASACDSDGGGHLIPDCQWVRDRISEANITGGGSSSGGGSVSLTPLCVSRNHIQNRAVDGSKLFTSSVANRVLGVLGSNTDPRYLQVNRDMIENRAIDGSKLFTSSTGNVVLGITSANSNPIYTKINNGMMGSNSVGTSNIIDRSVTGDKIENHTINGDKLADTPMIGTEHIKDNSVTKPKLSDNSVSTTKLVDQSVTNSKIADRSVTGNKMSNDVELPAKASVQAHTDYERRVVRNIIISPNKPTGGKNGDIWFRYV